MDLKHKLQHIDINYSAWPRAFLNVLVKTPHGEDDPSYYTFVSGSRPLSNVVDIRCIKEGCCGGTISIYFQSSGPHFLPIPGGFDFEREDVDLTEDDPNEGEEN